MKPLAQAQPSDVLQTTSAFEKGRPVLFQRQKSPAGTEKGCHDKTFFPNTAKLSIWAFHA